MVLMVYPAFRWFGGTRKYKRILLEEVTSWALFHPGPPLWNLYACVGKKFSERLLQTQEVHIQLGCTTCKSPLPIIWPGSSRARRVISQSPRCTATKLLPLPHQNRPPSLQRALIHHLLCWFPAQTSTPARRSVTEQLRRLRSARVATFATFAEATEHPRAAFRRLPRRAVHPSVGAGGRPTVPRPSRSMRSRSFSMRKDRLAVPSSFGARVRWRRTVLDRGGSRNSRG